MHLKRQKASKNWPIPRKGSKFLAMPSHNQKQSLPLIMVLREFLKVVATKREAKRILNEGKVKINGKVVKNVNYSLGLFDVLSLEKENYRINLSEHRKFFIEKIDEKEAGFKLVKVIGKKMLNGKKVQVNLSDGRNCIIKEDVKTCDSVLIDLKENKIAGILPLRAKSEVFVIKGKHAGKKGVIVEIINSGSKKIAKLDNKLNVQLESLIVVK